ncbi:MAG: DNA-formamidopyrimidine glycosylase family protein [Candidatus Thorarchaeota archaeon]|jgi:formamidopyrimidine-DNA glycosylase
MPELPELQQIAERLTSLLSGKKIEKTVVHNHIVVHGQLVGDFESKSVGETFDSVAADGKFLILSLTNYDLVLNLMLTGRLRTITKHKRPTSHDMVSIHTEDLTLWYSDVKKMGRIYLVDKGDYAGVADFADRGPSALDPSLTLDIFRNRLKRHRGQIKNVLRNQRFVKGIGNAYADEILLYAGILPFRRRSTLSETETKNLYLAMNKVLTRIRDIMSERSLDEISIEKRDFLMVHNRGGEICPLCGGRVSEVTANRFKTNYCQTCQK